VEAAKWNTTCEQGGAWKRKIIRRASDGTALPLATPCRHVVYPISPDDVPGAPVLDYAGTLDGDQRAVTFLITPEQTQALDPALSYRHKITMTDPDIGAVIVLLRGWFSVRGDGSTL
jgi:hypothetical protein